MLGDFATALLRRLDAEDAHRATIAALKLLPARAPEQDDQRLSVSAFGCNFSNPIGLAAGFDKNAEVFDKMLGFGFGFVEVGTLTPRPQPGNPRPRVFRLLEDRAIVNRYGFNNDGFAAARARLPAARRSDRLIAVNVGANKDSEDRIADYIAGVKTFSAAASYVALNISSPNTPGLRDLQEPGALRELLARAQEARAAMADPAPLLMKISPDVSLAQLDAIVRVARDAGIDGMIVSNTTISRPAALRAKNAKESGGLSGAPLFDLSTRMLAETFLRVDRQFPLIGVGGIDGPQAAFAKIEAGATLLQLYTALVFEGPGLVGRIKRGLVEKLASEGAPLARIVGRRARDWARR